MLNPQISSYSSFFIFLNIIFSKINLSPKVLFLFSSHATRRDQLQQETALHEHCSSSCVCAHLCHSSCHHFNNLGSCFHSQHSLPNYPCTSCQIYACNTASLMRYYLSYFGTILIVFVWLTQNKRLANHFCRSTTSSTIGFSTNRRDLVSSYGVSSTIPCACYILKHNGKQWIMGIQCSAIKAALSRISNLNMKMNDSVCSSITTLRLVTHNKYK